MKQLLITTSVFALIGLVPSTSQAQYYAQHPHDYVRLLGGYVVSDDSDYEFSTNNVKAEYDGGYNLVGALGRDFGSYPGGIGFRLEVEFGVSSDEVSAASANGVPFSTADGEQFNAFGMMNGLVYILPESRLQPYIGAGIGGAVTEFREYGTNTNPLALDDSDFVIAYQGIAGFDLMLTKHVDLVMDYRYFATTDASVTTTFGNQTEIGTSSHIFSTGLKYRF